MMALAVIAAMLADVLTFVCAVSIYSIGGEANPLARLVYVHAGIVGLVALKAAGTLVVLLMLSLISEPLRSWAAVAIVTMTLLAAGTNAYAVVIART